MKITGRHMDLTPALRRHIRSRVERLERYDVTIGRMEIVLSVNKLQHMAEAVCTINGKRFQAKTSTREMYATIDQLISRLEAQVRKYKEKRRAHKGKGRALAPVAKPSVGAQLDDVKVVRPKIPVLSRSEARELLTEGPGAMMLFTCVESGKLQVLQRLENGNVLLIDT
ncbi:ribosome hibernation-promoting factor, HPF/YfiA family [Petrachloros mirabilis]